jgi:two-component system sensor histidine kinase AlgZ
MRAFTSSMILCKPLISQWKTWGYLRIQPHFLFNTLNTAAALVQRNPLQAEHILMDLADLFRAALGGPDQVTLEAELTLTRRYLEIEQARLGERLTVHWDLPSPLPTIQTPLLSIQPLVENAICHGIEPSLAGGLVRIQVQALAREVRIEIRNPMPMSKARPVRSHQLGLQAVRARLAALGSGRAQLLTSQQGDDYVSTIHLPAEE